MKDVKKMTFEELEKTHRKLLREIDECTGGFQERQRLINKSYEVGREIDRRWEIAETKEFEKMRKKGLIK